MATSRTLMNSRPDRARLETRAEPAPAPAQALPFATVLPALASGGVLWACFHPLAWGWLAWIALAPLLCLVRSGRPPRRIYFSAWAGGLLFYVTVLQWMRVADYRMYATWLMLAFYCALYVPLAIYLTRVLERRTRLPLVITFPTVWVGLEYIRAFALTGFPWYYLAHSQHEYLTIIQVTDLGGTYAVSLLVAMVNALVFDGLYQIPVLRAWLGLAGPPKGALTIGHDWPDMKVFFANCRRGLPVETCVAGLLLVTAYIYGEWRLGQNTLRAGPGIALLQGNLDQRLRNQASSNQAARVQVTKHYADLCQRVIETTPEAELLIWPETSFPILWVDVAPDLRPDLPKFDLIQDVSDGARRGLREWARATGRAQLLGMGAIDIDAQGKERNFNTALFVDAQGQPQGRYDKMHRVPFGEYVPLREWLPFMNWFAPYDHDYSIRPGDKFTRFTMDGFRFGVLVCFEDTDPFLARHYARDEEDGRPVDFLVNISNDGWFDGTSEHETHLAVSRFRAIECRRSMVRAVNMGVSAVIDSDGRVLRPLEALPAAGKPKVWAIPFEGQHGDPLPQSEWGAYKKVSGVLVARVPIDDRVSVYVLLGDWLPALCWLLIGFSTAGVWALRRLRPAR